MILIQRLELLSEICDKILLLMDRKIFIALFAEHTDALLLQLRFTLIARGSSLLRRIFRDDGILRRFRNDLEL